MCQHITFCTVNSEIFASFFFVKLRISFVKMKTSRFRAITLSSTDIGKSCHSRDFSTSQICLIQKLSRKFPDFFTAVYFYLLQLVERTLQDQQMDRLQAQTTLAPTQISHLAERTSYYQQDIM